MSMIKRMLSAVLVIVLLAGMGPLHVMAEQGTTLPEQEDATISTETDAIITPESDPDDVGNAAVADAPELPEEEPTNGASGFEPDSTDPVQQDPASSEDELFVENDTVDADEAGEVTWTFDETSGILTISGVGAMSNYSKGGAPYYGIRASIIGVQVDEGITHIGKYAFYGLTAMRDVSLPDTVTSLGTGAFSECTALTAITLPDSVSSIGFQCFYGCTSLTQVKLPLGWSECPTSSSSGTINADYCGQIFKNCKSLVSITVPEGMTALPSFAFNGANYLEEIILPDSLTEIRNHTFYNCVNLKAVAVPAGVTSIGKSAFCYCSDLESVSLPDGLTELGLYAFNECTSLKSVQLPASLTTIGDYVFYKCTALESVAMEDLVTSIGYQCFYGCSKLTSIALSEGLTSLPQQAFYNCGSLTSIELPDGITSIGYQCFYGCTSLTQVKLPLGWSECPTSSSSGTINADYCGQIFKNCKSLVSITVPEGMTALPSYAFNGANYLEEIILPDSLTEIRNHTFYNCVNLKAVAVPAGVTSIGKSAFCYCSDLESVSLSDGLKELGLYAFNECTSLKSVQLPATLTTIGDYVFYKCTALESVTMEDLVTSIGYQCFYGCSKLTSIALSEGLTSLPQQAFYNCSSLTSIELPDGITAIGYQCFCGCTSLAQVNIPLNWTDCPSSSSSGTSNTDYCGQIFKNCKSLVSITVPEGMTALPSYALNGADYLEEVILPDSLTEIKNHTFYNCKKLKAIEIPAGVTRIGKSAFCDCSALEDVSLPEGLTELPLYGFNECTSLREIHLPDSITTIGYKCFYGCTSLEQVNIPLNWTTCSSGSTNGTISSSYCGYIFENCDNLMIIDVPEGMTQLPDYAFNNCNMVQEVRLPETLRSISPYCFNNCKGLLVANMPQGVQSIGKYAFSQCSSLMVVNITDSVTDIGEYAFKGCPADLVVNYQSDNEDWNNISISTKGNSVITDSEPDYNQEMTGEYGAYRPESLGQCFYSSPDAVSFTSFYGGVPGSSSQYMIDVNDAFFGKNARNYFVTVPVDSYITLRFANVLYCRENAYLILETTGIVNERADLYFVLENGNLHYYGELQETTESHRIALPSIEEGIIGLRFVGKDLDGASPGFDIVDVTLVCHNSGKEAYFGDGTSVTMKRNGQIINLLRENQTFYQGDEELVTIIAEYKRNDQTAASVMISQGGNTILENMGGTFVDIKPGVLFAPNDSVYATYFDVDGNIVESVRLRIFIMEQPESRNDAATTGYSYKLFYNKNPGTKSSTKYVVSQDGYATYKGSNYTATDGIVYLPEQPDGTVTFSQIGQQSRTISAERLKNTPKIYLQKWTEGVPIVSGVWVNNQDVMHYGMTMYTGESTKYTFEAEIDWNLQDRGVLQLWQDGVTADFDGNGKLTLDPTKVFDLTEPVYILASTADGTTVKQKLMLQGSEFPEKLDFLNGFGVDFGDSFKVTLPDSVPFFGGGEISAGIDTVIPVTVVAQDGVIHAALGVDLKLWDSSDSWTTLGNGSSMHKLSNDVTSFTDNFKRKLWSVDGIKDRAMGWKEMKSLYKKGRYLANGSLGFEADFVIMGFMEGIYDKDGNITWLETGMILNPSIDVKYGTQTSIGPVPVYLEAILSANIEARMNLRKADSIKKVKPSGVVSGDISLRLGGGVGLSKVVGIGGGGKGTLKPYWAIRLKDDDYFRLTASLNLYAKAFFMGFEYTKDFKTLAESVWVEIPKSGRVMSNPQMDTLSFTAEDVYNTRLYQRSDLSYLDQRPDRMDYTLQASSAGSNNQVASNVYLQSVPEYVVLEDGTAVAVWLDAQDSEFNNIHVYYSRYNGSSWSEPKPILNDGTIDNAPVLELIDGEIYVAWQNATRSFADSEMLDDMAPDFDITVAKLVGENRFESITIRNSGLDMMPVLCGNEDAVYAVWVNNGSDSWFGEGEENSICVSTLTGGTWSEAEARYTGLYAINSLAADARDTLYVAYSMDTDGDVNTNEDLRLYCNGERYTASEEMETAPVFRNHSLCWYSNGKVYFDQGNGSAVFSGDRYQLLDLDGETAMLYLTTEEQGNVLMISYYDDAERCWKTPAALTDTSWDIIGFSGYADENGVLRVLLNRRAAVKADDDEMEYGVAELSVMEIRTETDLAISSIIYDDASYVAGESMTFLVELTNLGQSPVQNYTLSIMDGEGTVLASYVREDQLLPGEIIEEYISYQIPEDAVSQDLTFRVDPIDDADTDSSNNSFALVLSYENLRIEQAGWGKLDGTSAVIYADVVNRGYTGQHDLSVTLHRDSLENEAVAEYVIDHLEPLELQCVSLHVNYEPNAVYYLRVSEGIGECNTEDNDALIYFASDEQEEAVVVASGWSGDTTWTLTDDGTLTFSGSGKIKSYDYNAVRPWDAYADQIISVVVEEGITCVGSCAFMGMEKLKSVELPESLTHMGEAAFYGTGLSSVEIPASLWTIQPYTFKNCTNLTSVTFHKGNLEKISDGAFYGTGLTELVLPDCLKILDTFAFKGCADLTSITIGNGLTELREAVFYGTAIPTITIPEGITKIGPYAFKNCVALETVDMPSTLTSVGEASFYADTALRIVELPDAVTEIGNYAFRKCESIETLKLSEELVTVGECAFYGCTSLTELVIPDKVTTIKPYAFKTCTGLTSVTLGNSVETIGEGAFNTCTGLKTLVFPASLKEIGDYAFANSENLWKLTFEGDAPTIGTGAFKGLDAEAWYPGDNATWTSAKMQNYGGTIIWKAN